jgi:hypothetical protein
LQRSLSIGSPPSLTRGRKLSDPSQLAKLALIRESDTAGHFAGGGRG